ncbi:cysteine hydrolase family protein [Evansella sp. AB-rgal1]|uniref:cysteine hydrolase family protein n=1 Tax=Evansella sp. AB-rgal1 TaxID=3242696 RepID=UPI00359DD4B5
MDSKLIQPERTALIVVDMQNDYCHPDGAMAASGQNVSMVDTMTPNLSRLIDHARKNDVEVIFIQTIHEDCTNSPTWKSRLNNTSVQVCRKNSWGSDFYEVQPLSTEPIVNKHRYSAFIHTRLDTILRSKDIKNLIMTGVSTNVCVESTARDGFMLDYNIIFLADCTAAFTAEEHNMALENINNFFGVVSTSHEVIEKWKKTKQSVGA